MDPVRDAARAVLDDRGDEGGTTYVLIAADLLDALQAAVDAADEAEGRMVLAQEREMER